MYMLLYTCLHKYLSSSALKNNIKEINVIYVIRFSKSNKNMIFYFCYLFKNQSTYPAIKRV